MSRPQHLAAIAGRRHALYRFFDDHDVLLYVGITHNLPTRMGNHRAQKPWWYDVADMRVVWFPDRKSVLAAEKAAIKNEKPLYNIDHNDEMYCDPFTRLTTEEKLAYLSPAERDIIAAPAYDEGQSDLAFALMDLLNDQATTERAWSEAQLVPQEERYSENPLVEATYAAMRQAQERALRLEEALRHLLDAFAEEDIQRDRQYAEEDVIRHMGTDHTDFDVFCWTAYVVAERVREQHSSKDAEADTDAAADD